MKRTVIIISAIAALGFLLRVFLAMDNVYSGGYINFPQVDSYFHADFMRQMLNTFPSITVGYSNWLYDWLVVAVVWVVGLGEPSVELFENVVLFVPPLLAVGTIILAYLIGQRLFSRNVGIIAALLVAIIPSEFFSRSFLGVIDHHAAEVFFTTFIAAIVIYVVTQKNLWTWKTAVASATAVICIIGYRYIWAGVLVLMDPGSAGSTYTVTLYTTTEAIPLMKSSNYFPLLNLLFGASGAYLLARRGIGWHRFILIGWFAATAILTIWQVRFDYYMVIPVSLLIGYLIHWTYSRESKLRQITRALAVMGMALIVVLSIPVYIGMVNSEINTPSDEWNKTLTWVKNNTPDDAVILAWCDYGHWIKYRAERNAYVTPGQGKRVPGVAKMFLSYDGYVELPGDYIIIDRDTAYNFTRIMSIWAGYDYMSVDDEHTLVGRLYEYRGPPEYGHIYGEEIKVFKWNGK